jgi:hypothetical protein
MQALRSSKTFADMHPQYLHMLALKRSMGLICHMHAQLALDSHLALEQQAQARVSLANLKWRLLWCRCAQLKQSQLKQRRERTGAGRQHGREVIDQQVHDL